MALINTPVKPTNPYQENSTNVIYNLLFCDSLDLYNRTITTQSLYPWNILFSQEINESDLQTLINDETIETRAKILAYYKMKENGFKPGKKELLGVIIEVGLDEGLDVLASFQDGTARYINQTGKVIIWETSDEVSADLTTQLFENSLQIVKQIGPWNEPRKECPAKGMARISFLVSDGLYFGEAPMNALFSDSLARPALLSATSLMSYLTEKVLNANN